MTVHRNQVVSAPTVPGVVRGAGVVVAAEGLTGLLIAAVLVWRGLVGADRQVVGGVSLAVCFGVFGAGVLAAGWALTRGNRWGRGVAVFVSLLLLPVAWYVGVDSQRWAYGVPVGVLAMVVLVMLNSSPAVRWAAGGQRKAAGPEVE